MNSLILPYDAFLRSVKQNTDIEHVFLLGAGASISSGVQSAEDCIWEWKKDIFVSKNPNFSGQYKEFKLDVVKKSIQKWIDNEGCYLPLNHPDEYSTYAELAYPIDNIRRKYFENICRGKEPYIGYKILCLLVQEGMVHSVFTTNFDNLIVKATHQMGLTPIEITLDSAKRIYRLVNRNELLCVELHGDYKYGPLKNTSNELDSQHDDFVNALAHHLNDKHLIVMGYSGRDRSLINALKKAYKKQGSGILFWCGYGHEISSEINELLSAIKAAGREAFFIPTDGFDNTLIHLANNCYENNEAFQNKLNKILQATNNNEWVKTPFSMDVKHTNTIIRSNLFPFSYPKELFQFEASFSEEVKPWQTIRELTDNTTLVVAPLKNMLYSLGTLSDIHNVFGERIKSDVKRTPITSKELKNGTVLKNIYLKALVKGICQQHGLQYDGFNRIWQNSNRNILKIGTSSYEIFEAARVALFFDNNINFAYLSLKPSFYIENFKDIPFETKLEIARNYYDNLLKIKPNYNFNTFLEKWKGIMFTNGQKLEFDYPVNSGSGFRFKISNNTMHVRIMKARTNYDLRLPNDFNAKTLLHSGIQYLEPQLEFINKYTDRISRDFHPMRGLIQHRPYDFPLNDNVHEAEINLGIICPLSFSDKLFNFLNRLNNPQSAGTYNPDYLMDYPGFLPTYGIPLNIPVGKSSLWQDCQLPDKSTSTKETGLELLAAIKKRIDNLDRTNKKLVIIIFIPTVWNNFTKIDDEQEKFDLHDHIKAYAAQKGIATQFIQESTLTDQLVCQINWWLSLSFYVKALRTPWILSGLESKTAFVGIGYSINHKRDKEKVVLGCSHIYSASGEGLKYKLSKVDDCYFDKKNNPFLSYKGAYKFGVSIREMFFTAMGELPKRVVVHKRTPFKKDEVKGIVNSLKKTGITEVDLIEINFEEDARFIALKLKGGVEAHGFPLSRGTCFLLDSSTALLFTHGIVPSVKANYRNYYLGGKNIPVPLKVKKHYGTSNISSIATEILGLTKMNWNSFDLYSKLPATIQTSNEIARIGWLLSRFEGKIYDYRNFM